ncbi:MAG TPA: glycosyltransferase family 4 protein, partial [Bryobacteraceae bacterium]
MHICFLCSEYPPGAHGGLGSVMQTLGRSLTMRGHSVTIVGFYPVPRTVEDSDRGVRIIRLPHARIFGTGFGVHSARLRAELARIHSEHPIDILEGPELSLAMIPSSFPAVKVIRMHGGHYFFAKTLGKKPRPWRSWLERRSFSRADQLCAVSRHVAEITRVLLNLGNRAIEVLENPVNTTLFAPKPDIAEDPRLVAFVGTVCEKKGIGSLIEAMPEVVTAVPGVRLAVYGRDWRSPKGASFTESLRARIPGWLRDSIEFAGVVRQEDLPARLARAAVCAYPSFSETHSVSCLERMTIKKPVVASNAGPFANIVK